MKTRALSAGILLHHQREGRIEVLLVHPGGPWWKNKDEGAWQLPKGAVDPGEEPADAALREFEEEVGTRPEGPLVPLCRVRQSGGKSVEVFAVEGDLDADAITSNLFDLEWPPRSGRLMSFPEVDRARWFTLPEARIKMLPSQLPILDSLEQLATAAGDKPADLS